MSVPTGYHDAYPSHHVAQDVYAQACQVLPSRAVGKLANATVTGTDSVANVPDAEVDNLFPSVSRTVCAYRWRPSCLTPTSLRDAALYVTTMPNDSQAIDRYTYVRMLIAEDEVSDHNDFSSFSRRGVGGYKFIIGSEALTRLVQGRFILDLHTETCATSRGAPYRISNKLMQALQLPVHVTRSRPRAIADGSTPTEVR